MTENCSQRPVSAMAMSPWLWWTGLFLLLALGPTSAVLSQEFPPAGPQYFSTMGDAVADAEEAQSGFLYSDAFTGRTGKAFGALVRGGYLTGPTVGRDKGIAPLEMMPYAFIGDGMIFADIRGFRGDRGDFGANLGLGYRQFIEPLNRIFGVNFFYDIDNTTSYTFNQLGFGIETLGELFDARANAYFPYGDRNVFLGATLVDGSQHFVGHRLLYDVRNAFLSSLLGADAEIGFPLPGAFAQRHDLRIFGGGYHYETDDNLKFAGGSARLQGNPIPSVQLQLQVTHDDVFSTNVMFGAQVSWGGFKQDPRERPSQFARMTTPIQRQYTVSTTRTFVIVNDVEAFNQSTGRPYFFNHVASATSLLDNGQEIDYNTDPVAVRDGTVEHPYLSIDESETRDPSQPGDIVFVHADSQYDGETVALKQGLETPNGTQELHIRYLGNGFRDFEVSHLVTVPDVGVVTLPTRNDDPGDAPIYNENEPVAERGDRPLFTNGIGDGVTLASFAEFSGFQIGDEDLPESGPSGHGAFGGAVESLQLNQNVFAYADGDGIRFENALDNINILDTNIFNPDVVGLRIIAGAPEITFGASVFDANDVPEVGLIVNQTDNPNLSLAISSTLAGTDIDLTNATILNGQTDNGSVAGGISIFNTDGNIIVGRATINSAEASAIAVRNVVGTVDFVRAISILDREAAGIELRNNEGRIRFLATEGDDVVDGGVNITWSGEGTDPAITWQNNNDNAESPIRSATVFSVPISILGSGGDAIALGTEFGNSGTFSATRGTTIDVNGANTVAGVGIHITQNTGEVFFGGLAFNGASTSISIDGREQQGILIEENGGISRFLGVTTVDNSLASLASAVEIHDNLNETIANPASTVNGAVRFDTLNINDAQQDVDLDFRGAGLSVYDNPALVSVESFNAADTIGISLFSFNVGAVGADGELFDGLVVGAGAITGNTELPAVDIEQTVYGVLLDEVNSADSAREGIRLVDNLDRTGARWGFQVQNGQIIDLEDGVSGLGGVIEDAAGAGVFAEDAGSISLNYMIIENNGAEGVRSVRNTELEMFGNEVITNAFDGLLAIDTRLISVAGDPNEVNIINFDSNGTDLLAHHQIRLVSTEDDLDNAFQNEWTLANNVIVHNLPNAAVFATNRDPNFNGDPDINDGHSQILFIQTGDQITLEEPGFAADFSPTVANLDPEIDIDLLDLEDSALTAIGTFLLWDGNVIQDSEIDNNLITFTEGGAIGVAVRALSEVDGDRVILDITDNTLIGGVGNNVGVYFDSEFTNSTLLSISGNLIDLQGRSGVADDEEASFDIGIYVDNLDRQANVAIVGNTGTITSDNGIAVAFNNVFGFGGFRGLTRVPANYNISLNEFTMEAITTDATAIGFILGTPVGGEVDLNSANGENTIDFVNTANGILVIPQTGGAFNGTINVNGQQFPQ